MKEKSSSGKNKKNPLKLVKNPEAQVLNLIEKLEKSTERRLSGFVQELVKLKKNQAKLQEKLAKTQKAEAKRAAKKKTGKTKLKTDPESRALKKKKAKQNPFTLVENKPKD